MIDEKATFEKFGYYPKDLKPKSKKKIVAVCDDCGKARAIRKGAYYALCSSCAMRGENNPAWRGGNVKRICENCGKEFFVYPNRAKKGEGKFCSLECAGTTPRQVKRICRQCDKEFSLMPSLVKNGQGQFCSRKCMGIWYSEHHRGEDSPSWTSVKRICLACGKEFFAPPSWVKRGHAKFCSRQCARKVQRIPKHHTKPERTFEKICKKYNLPFKYTGDGSFWIGKNPSVNPDFVECNGKKIAVEIFGDWWHSPLLNRKLGERSTLAYRKKILKKYGWKLIVLWETDLKRDDAEHFVLAKLKEANCGTS